MDSDCQREIQARAAWQGVSAAFAALGRTFICVDREFRVIHGSQAIDEILGEGSSERVARSIHEHSPRGQGPFVAVNAGALPGELLEEAIAGQVGVPSLTAEHWKVITFCREDAAKEGQPPGLRRISKLSGVGTKDL